MSTGPEEDEQPTKKGFITLVDLKTPPMPERCRVDAGFYLDQVQEGVLLSMPLARRMRTIGPRVYELRLSDGLVDWRVIYRIDLDVILAVDSFRKTTPQTPNHVIARCRERLARFDAP